MSSMPLEGIRVVDWTAFLNGPTTSMLLGQLGAEVIKVESKDKGDPYRKVMSTRGMKTMSPDGHCILFELANRNKKGIAIDLKKPEGREVIYRLVEKSDVFVQNFRPGTAQRLRLDYETLSQYNPRLIYASSSGFGTKGPYANKPAMDFSSLAYSGMMMVSGDPGMPPTTVGYSLGDFAGAFATAYGILAALVVRERLGIGQEINASLLSGLMYLQDMAIAYSHFSNAEVTRIGHYNAYNPLWNCYPCKCGKWIMFAHLQSDVWWPTFCRVVGIESLEHDPRFKDALARGENHKELIAILDKVFATKTRQEWFQIFEGEDLIYCPVNTIKDLFQDPQIIANDYIVEFEHPSMGKIKFAGCPVRFSKTPAVSIRNKAPERGEHTEEVLTEVGGYSREDIAQLRDKGVI